MQKKLFLLITILLLVFNSGLVAQCPLGVGINRDTTGFVCKDIPVNYTAIPSNGAINPQYVWVIDGDTVGTDSILTNTTPGNINVYITSDNCPDTATNNLFHQSIFYDIVYETIVEECNQSQADVRIDEIRSIGGTPPYSYNLLSEGGLGEKEVYFDLPIGIYPVLVTDDNGCEDTTWVSMDVKICDLPNPIEAITPNGDGYNDFWFIQNIRDYPNNKVYIFDRWGQRVYFKKGYDNTDGWEAKYAGVGLPVSTYYYVLEVEQEKSEDFVLKGAISIFR